MLTASLPERHVFRDDAIRSVAAQTLAPVAHIVAIDYERVGPGAMLNRMMPAALAAGAEWVAQAADDDLLYPHHLETLYAAAEDADVIYPYCEVEGRNWSPNAPFDADRLRRENYIPATTMIRASLCAELGWREETANGWEDWDFWLRALDAGARFKCVPEVTWLYRFHGSNLSWRTG
jgi:GT2 family glycosyltransferase